MAADQRDTPPLRRSFVLLATAVPLSSLPLAWLLLSSPFGYAASLRDDGLGARVVLLAFFGMAVVASLVVTSLLARGRQLSVAVPLCLSVLPWVIGLIAFRREADDLWLETANCGDAGCLDTFTALLHHATSTCAMGMALSTSLLAALGGALTVMVLLQRRRSWLAVTMALLAIAVGAGLSVARARADARLWVDALTAIAGASAVVVALVTHSMVRIDRRSGRLSAVAVTASSLACVGTFGLRWASWVASSLRAPPVSTQIEAQLRITLPGANDAAELGATLWLVAAVVVIAFLALTFRKGASSFALVDVTAALLVFVGLSAVDGTFDAAADRFATRVEPPRPMWKAASNFQPLVLDVGTPDHQPYAVAGPTSVSEPDGTAFRAPYTELMQHDLMMAMRGMVERHPDLAPDKASYRVAHLMPDRRLTAEQLDRLVTAALDAQVVELRFRGVPPEPAHRKPPVTRSPASWVLQLDPPDSASFSMQVRRGRVYPGPKLAWPRQRDELAQHGTGEVGVYFDGSGEAAEFLPDLAALSNRVVLLDGARWASPSLDDDHPVPPEPVLAIARVGLVQVTGQYSEVLLRVELRRFESEIADCYHAELDQRGALSGDLRLSFTIDPSGRVLKPKSETTNVASRRIQQCVVERLRTFIFPPVGYTPSDVKLRVKLYQR